MGNVKKTFRHKGLCISVWENSPGKYTFSFQKSYKDKNTGEWRTSATYFANEIKALLDLLSETATYLSEITAADKALDYSNILTGDEDVPF